jgi:hypothetical protein
MATVNLAEAMAPKPFLNTLLQRTAFSIATRLPLLGQLPARTGHELVRVDM